MSTPTTTAPRSNVLGRYTTPQGGRKLCARIKDGQTFLADEPTSGRGRIYPVDVVPADDGLDAVEALVNLYLEDARSSCSIPMAHTILDADLIEVAAMSAYLVSKDHVNHLVQATLTGCLDTEGRWNEYGEYRVVYGPNDSRADGTSSEAVTASQFGQLLLSENIRSVEGRYPDTSADAGDLPGSDAYYWLPYVFEPVVPDAVSTGRLVRVGVDPVLTCAQLVNALRGYCYQSCESEDWLQTEAYAIVTALREKLLGRLPGVEQADGWAL